MSLSTSLKAWMWKRPGERASREAADVIEAPRAPDPAPAPENPYLAARRLWNDHVGAVVSSRQGWQVIGILSLLIALAAVGGMITIGSQSKFIPYLVEVDKAGRTLAAGPLQPAAKVDARIIHAAVADFVSEARLVTPDVALQRQAVFRVYAMLSARDPATAKMNEWLNGTPEANPFKRAEKEMVSVELNAVLPQSPDTWQVDWVEATRDRDGVLKTKVSMRALVTVYTDEPTSQTSEEQMRRNPLGIYVRDFSWSRLL